MDKANKSISNEIQIAKTPEYYKEFWHDMCAKQDGEKQVNNVDPPLVPAATESRFSTALKEKSLFRRISTVSSCYTYDEIPIEKFFPKEIFPECDFPDFIGNVLCSCGCSCGPYGFFGPDGFFDPDELDNYSIYRKWEDISASNLESDLIMSFAKIFGKDEEKVFIQGNGRIKGILHDTKVGKTVSGNISFDDVKDLYDSVNERHRNKGSWLMNTETKEKLKKLKGQNNQDLWDPNNDTIFEKPVLISEFMPSNDRIVAFGDFSYYHIIEWGWIRILLSKINDKCQNKYTGFEHLDGYLICPEAVKVLEVKQ
ncbi:MAG: phage major capsid protein [Aeriscardovia sp.]|nr:phage major capsid protein [Aeriscardovia sp.]